MNELAVLIHGGGPTAVWNASLAALALEARKLTGFPHLMAARGGFRGLWTDEWLDLSAQSENVLREVALAPGSAIGSSREDLDYERTAARLRERCVRFVFLSGGNGTMMAAHRLQQACGGAMAVIGIPKTIDNDIPGLNWTPGYGSVARFFAHAARDAGEDNRSLPSPVMVLETLGRDTGWVTASTALARYDDGDAPHLIYLPEKPVSLDRVCADVDRVLVRLGRCVIAVCEGMKDEKGEPFGAEIQRERDGGTRLASTLGHALARSIGERLAVRARSERPGLVGRSFAALASEADRELSWRCGQDAARAAGRGESGVMVTGDGTTVQLREVAGNVRAFPQAWISSSGCDVADAFTEWLRPIAGNVPGHRRLGVQSRQAGQEKRESG
ncbi:MAG: diphosphate--fructose-6-phosphate 1-phosphotransferase [Acidobacteria bacterium]|nr:diphosphate--fructose-6-phosphate 1-phosphotransferase [Acidobacteriota bacterium]